MHLKKLNYSGTTNNFSTTDCGEHLAIVFGASGRLGRHLKSSTLNIKPIPISYIDRKYLRNLRPIREIICNLREVVSKSSEDRICVIYLAGLSGVDDCFKEEALSRKLNIDYPLEIQKEIAYDNIPIYYSSSEYVYDGRSKDEEPATEEISLKPKSVYGRHKLEAECRLLDSAGGAKCILRLGKILTLEFSSGNLLHDALSMAIQKRRVFAAVDQVFNPAHTEYFVDLIHRLLSSQLGSTILNVGSNLPVSRYKLIHQFLSSFQLNSYVEECLLKDLVFREPRGGNLSMDTQKCRTLTGMSISVDSVIRRYLNICK